MALVAPDGRLLQVNAALCRITGHSEAALLATTRQELTHPDDRSRNHELADQLLAGETDAFEMEKRYRHVAGHYVWVHLSASLVRDDAGNPLYFVAQIQDIEQRKRAEIELRHVADHDALTGLLNRRGFERQLTAQVQEARTGHGGTLLMLDLDNFKYVNDNLGHEAGDRVIESVARLLRDRLRGSDCLARFGGDEFAVLLSGDDGDGSVRVAHDLVDAIRVTPAFSPTGAHRLTTSIGVTMLDGSQATADEALNQATTALYTAKDTGRDQVRVWADGSEAQQTLVARKLWARRIEDAFQSDGFVLLAQPILTLTTRAIHHHELLLRMRDTDGSLILPAAFLPTAERFDLVQGIDRWVVAQAIHLLYESDDPRRSLAVNLSGRSIGDPVILELLGQELPRALAGRLTVEITETADIGDVSAAGEFARNLRHIGCQVALDDFGVGFGSFGYLKHLPFDSLKIDGGFVKHCTSNRTDRLIVEAIVGVAAGLGRETVAECVEDAATLRYLEGIGVDQCQGYHISRPLPLDDAFAFDASTVRLDDAAREPRVLSRR